MTRKLIALTMCFCLMTLPIVAGCGGGGGGNPSGESDEEVQRKIQEAYKKAQEVKGKGIESPPAQP
jgi:hypothetical protein